MGTEREMGSRGKDETTPHQPLLSSLIIRPSNSNVGSGGGRGGGADYEPGEVHRHARPYSRSDRYDTHGYRMRSGSVSPMRHRDVNNNRLSPGFEHSVGGPRNRGFVSGRGSSRYRDYSPSYSHGRDFRFACRGYDRSARDPGSFGVEVHPRNNPNVRPREGAWICSDPSCNNLNFARLEQCNNCNRPRYAPSGSPRRDYPGPPFAPQQLVPAASIYDSPNHMMSGGYGSPPHDWLGDAPRSLRPGGQPNRHEGRYWDPLMRGDYRQEYPDIAPRERYRYDKAVLPDWVHMDRGRDIYFDERRGYGRRVLSPPPMPAVPPLGWGSDIRDRSRSPVRGEAPTKVYHRDIYMNRRRDDGDLLDETRFSQYNLYPFASLL